MTNTFENIKNRVSTRTYSSKTIERYKIKSLLQIINEINNDKFRIELKLSEDIGDLKLGTYGVIKNAQNYLFGIMKTSELKNKQTLINFGYEFERLVLHSTELDLGTCWMAGTYNSADVKDIININSDEQVVMVSPIGYSGQMRSMEKLQRLALKANQRKPFNTLFLESDFNTPIIKEGIVGDALEMVRLAPSAKNIQPWRVIKVDSRYDFYGLKKYSKEYKGFNLLYNDLGIAKYHFESILKHNNIDYAIEDLDLKGTKTLTYMFSFTIKS